MDLYTWIQKGFAPKQTSLALFILEGESASTGEKNSLASSDLLPNTYQVPTCGPGCGEAKASRNQGLHAGLPCV